MKNTSAGDTSFLLMNKQFKLQFIFKKKEGCTLREHKGVNSNKDTATGKEVNVSYNCFYKNTNAIKMVVVRYIGQS